MKASSCWGTSNLHDLGHLHIELYMAVYIKYVYMCMCMYVYVYIYIYSSHFFSLTWRDPPKPPYPRFRSGLGPSHSREEGHGNVQNPQRWQALFEQTSWSTEIQR